MLTTLQSLSRLCREREERYCAARRAWSEGAEPLPAPAPWWTSGVSGQQFAESSFLDEVREAPCLLTAQVPPAVEIADDPAHWRVAANALIRAVVFDGMEPGHPAVKKLVEVLVPAAEAELRYIQPARPLLRGEYQSNRPAPAFPVFDGPVTRLSQYVLIDAGRSVVGGEPVGEEVAVLSQALDDTIPGVAGSVVADALTQDDNPLEALVDSGTVQPSEVLGAGLSVLSALVRLIETGAAQNMRRAA